MPAVYTYSELKLALATAIHELKRIDEALFRDTGQQFRTFISQLESIESRIQNEQYQKENFTADMEEVRTLVEIAYRLLRVTQVYCISQCNLSQAADYLLESGKRLPEKALTIDAEIEGIRLRFEPRIIYIRTPLLPHDSKPVSYISNSRSTFPITKTKAYAEQLRRIYQATIEDPKTVTELEADAFLRKRIFYLNVARTPTNMLDNDNRDYKGLTNVICSYLPGGDSANRCSFLLDGCCTSEIPEGTYITVQPADDPVLTSEQVISVWKHIQDPNLNGVAASAEALLSDYLRSPQQ